MPEYGVIAPGQPAHIAVLDEESLEVTRTLVAGAEAFAA